MYLQYIEALPSKLVEIIEEKTALGGTVSRDFCERFCGKSNKKLSQRVKISI